jgi:TonB family protein
LNRPDVRAQKRVFSPPPAPKPVQAAPAPLPVPEPPQIRTQTPPPALGDTPNIPPPPVQRAAAPPPEKPKLAFETPGSQTAAPSTQPSGMGRILPPKTSVDDAIKTITRGSRGGIVIGDMPDESGVGEALGRSPSPGRQASSLELLSDPMGVDFKPYLTRVLAAVRRNWLAIVPESARLGLRGKVTIQFSIARAGNVPKLVIVTPSGTEGLDRAAVAGISASNPFPPLPTEFRGDQVRLQLAFFYNVPTR